MPHHTASTYTTSACTTCLGYHCHYSSLPGLPLPLQFMPGRFPTLPPYTLHHARCCAACATCRSATTPNTTTMHYTPRLSQNRAWFIPLTLVAISGLFRGRLPLPATAPPVLLPWQARAPQLRFYLPGCIHHLVTLDLFRCRPFHALYSPTHGSLPAPPPPTLPRHPPTVPSVTAHTRLAHNAAARIPRLYRGCRRCPAPTYPSRSHLVLHCSLCLHTLHTHLPDTAPVPGCLPRLACAHCWRTAAAFAQCVRLPPALICRHRTMPFPAWVADARARADGVRLRPHLPPAPTFHSHTAHSSARARQKRLCPPTVNVPGVTAHFTRAPVYRQRRSLRCTLCIAPWRCRAARSCFTDCFHYRHPPFRRRALFHLLILV